MRFIQSQSIILVNIEILEFDVSLYVICFVDLLLDMSDTIRFWGKQEFRRTDFGSRLLAAEGEGGRAQSG
jgi:hypothetical protein